MTIAKKLLVPLLICASAFAWPAAAQSARSGAATASLVVPYAAGGSADTLGRKLAEVTRQQTGAVYVIENQGGAGGTIGTATVARAKPDGQTLLLASTSALTIGPHLNTLRYDPLKDLTPIASVGVAPIAILATRSAQFKDLAGALAYAKANPGAVRYGTPGVGSVAHLAIEGLQQRAGVQLTHVPYRGESPAVQDALGGIVELLVVNTPTIFPHVKAGSLTPLAVLEPERLVAWPDVPTLKEGGFEGLDYNSDFGIFVTAGLSDEAQKALSEQINNAVQSDEFQQLLKQLSLLPGSTAGAAYATQISDEFTRNGEIIKSRNIVAN